MRIIKKVVLAVFKDEINSRGERTKKMLQVRTNKQREVFYTLGGRDIGADTGSLAKSAVLGAVKAADEISSDGRVFS